MTSPTTGLLDRMTVRTRAFAIAGALLTVLTLVVGLTAMRLMTVDETVEDLDENTVPAAMLLLNIDRDAYQAQLAAERITNPASSADQVAWAQEFFQENVDQVRDRWALFTETPPRAGEAEMRARFDSLYATWLATGEQLAFGDGPVGNELLQRYDDEFEAMRALIDDISSDIWEVRIEEQATDINDQISTLLQMVISLLVLGIVVGVAISWLVARSITRSVTTATNAVDASAGSLAAISSQVGSNSEETSAQAGVVSAAAEEVSASVSTVAAAVEEMSVSIGEIAHNASEATRVSSDAVAEAESTNTTVAQLGVSSAEVGEVIEVITSIAEQTNLLALNATIEAARAGEAGKGFAVVANEVKELAKQTSVATEQIGDKIAAIQSDSTGAVEAIARIQEVIGRVADLQSTIASAVEEQTATTNEISRNVTEASRGATEIAENIASVATAARSTTEGAVATQHAADDLQQVALGLRRLVTAGAERPADGNARPVAAPVTPPSLASASPNGLGLGHGAPGRAGTGWDDPVQPREPVGSGRV